MFASFLVCLFKPINTIDFQCWRHSLWSCIISCFTGICATVSVTHIWDHEHAGFCSYHSCCHRWLGWNNISFQKPSNFQWLISSFDKTCQLCNVTFVNDVRSKRKRNNLRGFWKYYNEKKNTYNPRWYNVPVPSQIPAFLSLSWLTSCFCLPLTLSCTALDAVPALFFATQV